MIFNGVDVSELMIITKRDRQAIASPIINTNNLKSVNGIHFLSKKHASKIITIQATIVGDVLRKIDEINKLFNVSEPKKLILKDQPDRFYLAMLDSEYTPSSSVNVATIELKFNVFSGVAYSINEKTARRVRNQLIFENTGSHSVFPVFEFTTVSNIKMISFVHPNKKAFIIGESSGKVEIPAGVNVRVDFSKNLILLGNTRRIYSHVNSHNFSIEPGNTEIGIVVDAGATLPHVTATFREVYL